MVSLALVSRHHPARVIGGVIEQNKKLRTREASVKANKTL
jgi:hypothetical protein